MKRRASKQMKKTIKLQSKYGICRLGTDVIHNILTYLFLGYSNSVIRLQEFTRLRYVCKYILSVMKKPQFGEFISFDVKEHPLQAQQVLKCVFNMSYSSIGTLCIDQQSLSTLFQSNTRKIEFLQLHIDLSVFCQTTLNLKKLENVDVLIIYFHGHSNRKTCNIKLPKMLRVLDIERKDETTPRFVISKISGGQNCSQLTLKCISGDPFMWTEFFETIAPTLQKFQFVIFEKQDFIKSDILKLLENVKKYTCVIDEDVKCVDVSCFPRLTHFCVSSWNQNRFKITLVGSDDLTLTSFHIVDADYIQIANLQQFKNLKNINEENCGKLCAQHAI